MILPSILTALFSQLVVTVIVSTQL